MKNVDERKSWRVPPELDGSRIDQILVHHLPDWSRSRLQSLVKAGRVRIEGAVSRKPGSLVGGGTLIDIELPVRDPRPSAAESRKRLEVLWEDEELAVVLKPAGLLAHRGEGSAEVTLSELAVALFGELPALQGEDRPGIVHRLDRETSGIVVLGKTEETLRELMRQFREREVRKIYRALVTGEPRFDSDWIDSPIGRAPKHPDRMSLLSLEDGGRTASTYYEVLERFRGFASLKVMPKTGRTHQIRVHLTSIGLPVLGDRVYRGRRGSEVRLDESVAAPHRQMLHAETLSFAHPTSGEAMCVEAPMPEDFARVLEGLREHHQE